MKRNFIIGIGIALLQGCSAFLVPYSSDPLKKLSWADHLYDQAQRPLPAEELIHDALEICQASNDTFCLGKGYSSYGFFFRSPSIEKWEKHYRKNGFIDKSARYDNRLMMSESYFKKSIEEYLKINQYDSLTNSYLHLGFTYYFMGDHKNECEAYKKSLYYNEKFVAENPDTHITLPTGFSSYKAYIQTQFERAKC